MKILALFLVILTLSSVALAARSFSKKLNKEGSTISSQVENKSTSQTEASSMTTASPENVNLSIASLKPAKIVESLKGDESASKIPKETPEIIQTEQVYHDGSSNLGIKNVNCNLLSISPGTCVENDKCGWCGDKNKCIPGTSRGPLAPCLKDSFVFEKTDKWDPLQAGTINIQTGGAIQLVGKQDLGNVYVN